jgi:hypothetical protein
MYTHTLENKDEETDRLIDNSLPSLATLSKQQLMNDLEFKLTSDGFNNIEHSTDRNNYYQ